MPNVKSNELSERELDILKLVATGASNKEIAQNLYISLNTVKVHLRNIFSKIGATSRTEAAMYAVRIGLVEAVSNNISSQEGLSQDANHPGLSSDDSLADVKTTFFPRISVKVKRVFQYTAILSGLLLLVIAIGFVFDFWDIFPVNSVLSATPTARVQWFQLPELPNPRWGLAVANYENQIYAIGGKTEQGASNITEKFDPLTNTWTMLAEKPTAVSEINAATIGGVIYVPGGKLASGIPTDVTEIYDPQTNQWASASPLPKPLSAYALEVYEGQIFIFGGWDGKNIVDDVFVYDSRANTWSEFPSMPTARAYAGAVMVGGKIHVIGGWDGVNALSVNEVFLPDEVGEASQWKLAPSLPAGRYGMGIANLADIIFIFGGISSGDDLSTIVLSYGDQNWGQLQSPFSNDWAFLGAVTTGTKLYILGGKSQAGPNPEMWSYQAIFTVILPIIR